MAEQRNHGQSKRLREQTEGGGIKGVCPTLTALGFLTKESVLAPPEAKVRQRDEEPELWHHLLG